MVRGNLGIEVLDSSRKLGLEVFAKCSELAVDKRLDVVTLLREKSGNKRLLQGAQLGRRLVPNMVEKVS